MTTNSYFGEVYYPMAGEQDLFEDLIIESIQIKGIDQYYLRRDLDNFDSYFGESQLSTFKDMYQVEFYLESNESWGGDGSFLSKFGMEIRDTAVLKVSQKRFAEEITAYDPSITRPRNGDILAFPSPIDRRMRFFEISDVTNESEFYQLGKLYVYRVTVKNFEYTGEKFETGVDELDAYETTHSLTKSIVVESGPDSYMMGERVSQIGGFGGEVISFENDVLVLIKVSGELSEELPLIGQDSDCTRIVLVEKPDVGQDTSMNDDAYINNRVASGLVIPDNNPFSG